MSKKATIILEVGNSFEKSCIESSQSSINPYEYYDECYNIDDVIKYLNEAKKLKATHVQIESDDESSSVTFNPLYVREESDLELYNRVKNDEEIKKQKNLIDRAKKRNQLEILKRMEADGEI
jgi:hypothetical protein